MSKTKEIVAIFAAAVILSILFVACKTTPAANPETGGMDEVEASVYSEIKDYMISDGVSESLFNGGVIPGYEIFRGDKSDAGFDAMAASIMVDAGVIEDMLVMRSMIIVNADCVIVLRVNDVENAMAGLKLYHETQLKQWESYLPDQYKKTQETVIESAGDHVYYVTSGIRQDILRAIQEELK